MIQEGKNTPDTDPSGIFSTYKTGSSMNENMNNLTQNNILPPIKREEIKRQEESNSIKAIKIIVNGCVCIVKTGVWGIAVLGGLFVTALATNTIDRAISIINANIGTNITASGEVGVVQNNQQTESIIVPGLTSNTINTTSTNNTLDDASSKRRAILEARKAARLLEEQRKTIEKTLQ